MAFPEFLSPHGDAAASPLDPLMGSFTGLAQDFPGPQERPPAAADFLFATLPVALPKVPDGLAPEVAAIPPPPAAPATLGWDFLEPGPAVMPQETAIRLQQLTAALLPPQTAPMTALKTPSRPEVSLSALADHLNARFLQPDPAGGNVPDLLSIPVPPGGTPLPTPAPVPERPVLPHNPRPATPLDQLAAALALPAPALPSAAPGSIRAVVGALSGPPKAAPASRQGDVFFLDPPGVLPQPAAAPVEPEPLDFFGLEARPPAKPPVLFPAAPVPSLALPASVPVVGSAGVTTPDAQLGQRGSGLLLGGTGLILLGIFLACRLPLLWLDLDGADAWTRQKTEAGLLLQGAGALLALGLGSGSVLLRRWAPPLILATGWLSVFSAVLLLGLAGLMLGSEAEPQISGGDALLLAAALLVPLAYLFYYEKQTPAEVCAASDRAPVWTDRQTVPALMVLLGGLAVALTAGAMLRHQPAFPVPPDNILTGPPATALWAALVVVGLLTALCACHRRAAANGLLLLAALTLAGTLGVCGCTGRPAWDSFLAALGRPVEIGPSSPLLPLAAGLAPALLFLVLAMARRAFASPPPP